MILETRKTPNPYEPLALLMERFGADCTPEEFYWAVNEAFHAAEARSYDSIHGDMHERVRPVWKRLFETLPPTPRRLRFLDIGCGTGLVGALVAEMCPGRVEEMHLLDPSAAMLEVVKEKALGWPFSAIPHQGDVFTIADDAQYDVVTMNSVLHHIVDLPTFLARIEKVLRLSGRLLTAQDPRAGADLDTVFRLRNRAATKRHQSQVSPFQKLRRVVGPRIKGVLGIKRHGPVTATTNRSLLEKAVIKVPMDARSIWAVTDFHVPNQPGNYGKGINASDCQHWMPLLVLESQWTYDFHGVPWTSLSPEERRQEADWWAADDPHGRELALAWGKRA